MSRFTKITLVVVSVVIGLNVSGQYVESPCPEYFDYRRDGRGVHGVIRIPAFGYARSVTIKINFTILGKLYSNYAGVIEPQGSELSLLEDFNRGVPISYRVTFPITNPLPRLTMLSVNDNTICYGSGDVPGPNQYVTTIGLQHILYYKSEGGHHFRPKPVQPKPAIPTQTVDDNGVLISYDIPWEITTDEVRPVKPTRPQNHPQPPPQNWRPPPEWQRPPHMWEESPKKPPPSENGWQQPDNEWRPPPRPPPTEAPTWATQTTQPPNRVATQQPVEVKIESTSYQECGINGVEASVPLVFNGESYEKGKWPWLVALFKRRHSSLSYICAGTLVSDRHVVTAAHCMKRKSVSTSMRDIVIKAGVYNLDDWADDSVITRNLQAAAIHESYNASSLANDLAVMTLEKPVKFNANIRAACLWSGNTDLNLIVGGSGVVAGWGANEFGPAGKGEPRMVRMPVVSTATCRASKPDFHRLTSANTLCAGDRTGSGPCLGDSGGGLYILDNNTGRWRLRGVVSISLVQENGDDSCNLNEYIVFTDTAQYLSWINRAMNT